MLLCLCSIIKLWKNNEYISDFIKKGMFREDKTNFKIGVQGYINIKLRGQSYLEMACEWCHSKRLNGIIKKYIFLWLSFLLSQGLQEVWRGQRKKKSAKIGWTFMLENDFLIYSRSFWYWSKICLLSSWKVNLAKDLFYLFFFIFCMTRGLLSQT